MQLAVALERAQLNLANDLNIRKDHIQCANTIVETIYKKCGETKGYKVTMHTTGGATKSCFINIKRIKE